MGILNTFNTEADELFEKLNTLGFYRVKEKKFLAAELAFKHAIQIKENALVLTNLGAMFWNKLDFPKAIECMEKAIVHDPKYAAAHAYLGLIAGAENRWEEALKKMKEAMALEPDKIEYQWDHMITLFDAGRWTEGFN